LPSNTFLVGPLIPRTYAPLTADLQEFLELHQHTVYVGFGSLIVLSPKRITTILHSLINAHQQGLLDGVVWGLAKAAATEESIPKVVTIDGVSHSIADMRSGKHPFIRLLGRAPQRAILDHSSTQLFITHCGISSVYETLHAGVPVLGLPVNADQPGNAVKLEERGVGLWLTRSMINEQTVNDALSRLLSPNSKEASSFRENAARLQQMIHIANRDHSRGADLVELAAIPGAILAHESADWRMPWWKANNYDLYAFFITFILAMGYLTMASLRYAITIIRSNRQKQKTA
jgi:hypothetical protein